MSVVSKFCDDCCKDEELVKMGQAYGFDFTILLPIIIDLVVQWLGKCMDRKSNDELVAEIQEGSWWAKFAMRQSTRRALSDSNMRLRTKDVYSLSNRVLEKAKEDPELLKAMVEVRRNVNFGFDDMWS